MGDLSIKNVPDAQIAALRVRAERNHRSLEEELRAVLDDALREVSEKKLSITELSALARSLGLKTADEATQMIRQDRDSR